MKTCCQCSSRARAELDGRYYSFTHVPLFTDWRPLKRRVKKVVTVTGIDKVREAMQRLNEKSPEVISEALRQVTEDIQNKIAPKEASS